MACSVMAKVATIAVLCVAFLLAPVESARFLQQYDDAGVTAETFPSKEVPVAEGFAALHPDGPAAEYNYNLPADTTPTTAVAFDDEGVYTTDGVLTGETTADPSLAEESSYVFDAQHEDGPVFTPEDTTSQDFQGDSTSLAVDTATNFEFQETPDQQDELDQGDNRGVFAFDDSLSSP